MLVVLEYQLPGMTELSYCGGYYHHELVRTSDGWRSRNLREKNIWFINAPARDGTVTRATCYTG
jgi:hypothetical protein